MNIKHLCLFSFLLWLPAMTNSDFREQRHQVTHNMLSKFKDIIQIKGFCVSGMGEGVTPEGKQNHLKIVFDIDSLPTIEFARAIEVEMIQEFLNCVNSEEGIQDYLAEYPFPLKFVEIAFLSRHPENGLCAVWNNTHEEIIYDKSNPDNSIGPSIEVLREPYSIALRSLDLQN